MFDEPRVDLLRELLLVRFFILPLPLGEDVSIWSIVVRSAVRVRVPFCVVPFCIVWSDWVDDDEPLRMLPLPRWVVDPCLVDPCPVVP